MANQIPFDDERIKSDPDEHIVEAVHRILVSIGEDPEREGLIQTPKRVAQMYAELTVGYRADLDTLVNGAIFHIDYRYFVDRGRVEIASLLKADNNWAHQTKEKSTCFLYEGGNSHVNKVPLEAVREVRPRVFPCI